MQTKWEVRFNDGTSLEVEAEKYDPRLGMFLNVGGEVVGHVNCGTMKLVKKLGKEERA